MNNHYFVYILASRPNGAIYIGSTSNLRTRLEQHRAGGVAAHTRRYRIYTLVYFETWLSIDDARVREHRIKRWARRWKNELIETVNPCWRDLSAEIPD